MVEANIPFEVTNDNFGDVFNYIFPPEIDERTKY